MTEKKLKIIILAAGIGSRLGNHYPKALTRLSNDKTMMQCQIESLLNYVTINDIHVVVGYKKNLIMDEFPNLIFLYNNDYDNTNTSKSLLLGLQKVCENDVLWLNGDVVFETTILQDIINFEKSCMAVNTANVGEEEIKYTLNESGTIAEVSKTVVDSLGEAIGIYKIIAKDIQLLINELKSCDNNDYFEKGIEGAIKRGLDIYPVNISNKFCMEIDFEEDLHVVNQFLSR